MLYNDKPISYEWMIKVPGLYRTSLINILGNDKDDSENRLFKILSIMTELDDYKEYKLLQRRYLR